MNDERYLNDSQICEIEDILSSPAIKPFQDLISDKGPCEYYFPMGEGFTKAKPRQRGYIHGLSAKLNIDDEKELPYVVRNVRQLSILEAGDVIEILKDEVEIKKGLMSLF